MNSFGHSHYFRTVLQASNKTWLKSHKEMKVTQARNPFYLMKQAKIASPTLSTCQWDSCDLRQLSHGTFEAGFHFSYKLLTDFFRPLFFNSNRDIITYSHVYCRQKLENMNGSTCAYKLLLLLNRFWTFHKRLFECCFTNMTIFFLQFQVRWRLLRNGTLLQNLR